jgi:hypothetical protein
MYTHARNWMYLDSFIRNLILHKDQEPELDICASQMTTGVQSILGGREPPNLSVDHCHRKQRKEKEATRKRKYTEYQSVFKVRSQVEKKYPVCLASAVVFSVRSRPMNRMSSRMHQRTAIADIFGLYHRRNQEDRQGTRASVTFVFGDRGLARCSVSLLRAVSISVVNMQMMSHLLLLDFASLAGGPQTPQIS